MKDNLDNESDMVELNGKFSDMFLLLEAVRMPDAETGRMELTLTPSSVSLIRT